MNNDKQRSKQIRPEFMTPKPTSPKKSILGKRKYDQSFGVEFEDERYNQHIADDFFQQNMGHNVIELQQTQIQAATDKIFEDFRINLDRMLQNEAKANDKKDLKYNVIEVLANYEYYLANKNLFNV
jgi:hypothetical protein